MHMPRCRGGMERSRTCSQMARVLGRVFPRETVVQAPGLPGRGTLHMPLAHEPEVQCTVRLPLGLNPRHTVRSRLVRPARRQRRSPAHAPGHDLSLRR